MVIRLVDAARYIDEIFWRQNDPDGLEVYKRLEKSQTPKDVQLRRFLMINGSRFDLTNDNKPFIGTQQMSPGRGVYPEGLSR